MSSAPVTAHGPECACQRCRGFEPGNQLAVTHGAKSVVRLGPRVEELADQYRPHVPGFTPADEIALKGMCLIVARLEATTAAIESAAPGELADLRQAERQWLNALRGYLNDLGMTPTSRLRFDLRGRVGDQLRRYLEANYPGGDAGGA